MKRFALLAILLTAVPAPAGVYSPNEPCPFEVVGGVAKALPHPKFKSLLYERRSELIPVSEDKEFQEIETPSGIHRIPTPRGKAMARVRELFAKVQQLTPGERLAFSADLVRTGTLGKELAALKRLTGERPREYMLAASFVHAETEAGNWGLAIRNFDSYVGQLDPPTELPGTSHEQLQWILKIDKPDPTGSKLTYYQMWLRARQADADPRRKKPSDEKVVYPLFPDVKFRGQELPVAERAKLPADAVAIVQQLALWSPTDAGLLWLLAEVYAANGMLREADDTFDMCTWGSGLTGQKQLMEHRKIVKTAVEKLPPPVPEKLTISVVEQQQLDPNSQPDDGGIFAVIPRGKLLLFGGVFLTLAVLLLVLQVRAWSRRGIRG